MTDTATEYAAQQAMLSRNDLRLQRYICFTMDLGFCFAYFSHGMADAVRLLYGYDRGPKMALPMRTTVLPSSIATSKSLLMPIESSSRDTWATLPV